MRILMFSVFIICMVMCLKISASSQESLLVRIARDGNSIDNASNGGEKAGDSHTQHSHPPNPPDGFYPMPMFAPFPPPPFGPPGFPHYGHHQTFFNPPPPPPPPPAPVSPQPCNCNETNEPESPNEDENRNNSTVSELPGSDQSVNNGTDWGSELFPLNDGKPADPELARQQGTE